jgi:hypothetical protein
MYGVSVCQRGLWNIIFPSVQFNCAAFCVQRFSAMEAIRSHALHSLMVKPRLHDGEARICVD